MSTAEGFLSECSECGHKHWNQPMKQYEPCPQLAEGCQCGYVRGDASTEVLELREALDEAGFFWMLVRSHPQATFLPDAGIYTIWFDFEYMAYIWGHHLEYQDKTLDAVIARLKEITHA